MAQVTFKCSKCGNESTSTIYKAEERVKNLPLPEIIKKGLEIIAKMGEYLEARCNSCGEHHKLN